VEQQSLNSQEGSGIDYKRILYRSLRYWYLIVLSIAISLTITFLINRYTVPVYEVSARKPGDERGTNGV
jgi:uncharacterized protein involved in exopolysaccharide biosynthesis